MIGGIDASVLILEPFYASGNDTTVVRCLLTSKRVVTILNSVCVDTIRFIMQGNLMRSTCANMVWFLLLVVNLLKPNSLFSRDLELLQSFTKATLSFTK